MGLFPCPRISVHRREHVNAGLIAVTAAFVSEVFGAELETPWAEAERGAFLLRVNIGGLLLQWVFGDVGECFEEGPRGGVVVFLGVGFEG